MNGGADRILDAVDSWLLQKTARTLTATACVNKPMVRLPDGKELEVLLSGDAHKRQAVYGAVVFGHPDETVSGRKWFTRIGFHQSSPASPTFVTIVLETGDISVQAGASRVFATRPGVVTHIVGKCGVVQPTPSSNIFRLTPENAPELDAEIANPDRQYAVIVISPEPFSERSYMDADELLRQVVGLAKVAVIGNKAHTREITSILGRRFSAWGGAVNIILPPFRNGFISNHLISEEQLKYETGQNKSPESYVFYLLTHRMNLPHYQREITSAAVRQHSLALRLEELKTDQTSFQQIQEMLAVVQAQIEQKDSEIERLKDENQKAWAELAESEKRAGEIPRLQVQIESYQAAFETMKREGRLRSDDALPITSVADAIHLAAEKFGTAIIFSLNNKSDGNGSLFQPAEEVFHGFKWLAEVYVPSRLGIKRSSNLDLNIREKIPGWGYSAKQSDQTRGRYEEWYECRWEGKKYKIEEHIGCGTNTRPEETIRIAFAWDKDRKKVIIGFIGQHQRNTKS
ncbi:MAG: OmpH family outer membrane protein [Candidatus Pacebacteria bacterium]|nr:OmpH family outer membrane protein [Candidatus Paceibacterota bacterium]